MSEMTEFSRPFKLRRLGVLPVETSVEAEPAERGRLAQRLGLPAIARLTCRYRLTSGQGRAIMIEGWLAAEVTQVSVISDEPFDDAVAESFTLRLLPQSEVRDADFVDLDAPDVVPYEGDAIDLGEIACEQLALSLDPYPRRPGEGLRDAVDVPPAQGGPDELPGDVPGEEGGQGSGQGFGGAAGGGDDAGATRPNPFAVLAQRRKDPH